MPQDTFIHGEIVALDLEGRPSFNLLQNVRSERKQPSWTSFFDVMVLSTGSVMGEPLMVRCQLRRDEGTPEAHRASPVRGATRRSSTPGSSESVKARASRG